MWDQWERVRCPTLLLRGAESDMLLASTAKEMTRRGPKAYLIEFPDVGHVPTLMTEGQIAPVVEFLTRPALTAQPDLLPATAVAIRRADGSLGRGKYRSKQSSCCNAAAH